MNTKARILILSILTFIVLIACQQGKFSREKNQSLGNNNSKEVIDNSQNQYYYSHPLFHLIDSASVGDTLFINEGIYQSDITLYINKPITLIGMGNVELLCSDSLSSVIYICHGSTGDISLKNIKASHSIENSKTTIGCSGSVVWYDCGNGSLTLDSCEINGCGANGIYYPGLNDSSPLIIKDSYIHSNSVAAILTTDDKHNEIRINYGVSFPNIHFLNSRFYNNGYKYILPNNKKQFVKIERLVSNKIKTEFIGVYNTEFETNSFKIFSMRDSLDSWIGLGLSESEDYFISLWPRNDYLHYLSRIDSIISLSNNRLIIYSNNGSGDNSIEITYCSINDYFLDMDSTITVKH